MLENVTANLTNTTEMVSPHPLLLPSAISVFLLGLPANVVVLRLLLGKPGICSTSEIFILNLAVFNLIFSVIMPIEFAYHRIQGSPEGAFSFVWGLNHVGGPLLLCLLCLDRYMAVCQPVTFLRLKDPKFRLSLCFVVSVLTCAFCVSLIFTRCHEWHLIVSLLVGILVITSACNILLLRSLRQSGPGKKVAHPVKKRAFKTVLTVFLLINVHYVLPVVDYLLRSFVKSLPFLLTVDVMLLSTGSFVQPLSYLIRTKQLPKVKCSCVSVAETQSSMTDTTATIQRKPA